MDMLNHKIRRLEILMEKGRLYNAIDAVSTPYRDQIEALNAELAPIEEALAAGPVLRLVVSA